MGTRLHEDWAPWARDVDVPGNRDDAPEHLRDFLSLISIKQGKVSAEKSERHIAAQEAVIYSLQVLAKHTLLPDTQFYLLLDEALWEPLPFPVLVFANGPNGNGIVAPWWMYLPNPRNPLHFDNIVTWTAGESWSHNIRQF